MHETDVQRRENRRAKDRLYPTEREEQAYHAWERENMPGLPIENARSGAQPTREQCICSCHETGGFHECGWSCLRCGGSGFEPPEQPTPQTITVETTLEAIFRLCFDERRGVFRWPGAPDIRAHLEALVAAVRAEAPTLTVCDNCGFGFDSRHGPITPDQPCLLCHETVLEAENANLRAQLAQVLEWAVRYAADTTSVPTPPEWGPEKKEGDNAR